MRNAFQDKTWTIIYLFATLLPLFSTESVRASTAQMRAAACAKASKSGDKANPSDELSYLCSLPERVKKNVPEQYWMTPEEYEVWLKKFSTTPTAPQNLGKDAKQSHEKANIYVRDPDACHFFSSISPSVQHKKPYIYEKRTQIILDVQDLLDKCKAIAQEIKKKKIPACNLIEFAGHSTQSAGVDTLFGVNEFNGKMVFTPSKKTIRDIGQCLRDISTKNAIVFFSTCGGERITAKNGKPSTSHFWPGKEAAQKELAALLQMPIVSGIGFVDGTPDGGVICDAGWHRSEFSL